MILTMGIIFEMPLISWLLSQIGILKKSFFRNYRRHAIVILVVAAAVITPTGDPFNLTLVFLPLYALYELSIFFVKEDPKEEDEVSLNKI
jgi:sec-independent protein translocase protein TatC